MKRPMKRVIKIRGKIFRVGDHVGILYSDHTDYFFDDPVGEIISIEDEDGMGRATIQVTASVPVNRLYDPSNWLIDFDNPPSLDIEGKIS